MQLDDYVNTFGRHLTARFGERVHKLPLHAGFSCPNRDGTRGHGGCSFCSVRSFNRSDPRLGIAEQLEAGRKEADRARRYLAYLQAYTNTYAAVEELRRLYAHATAARDIVGLAVGTRPDCVTDDALALLADYRQRGYEVWLELGLQSAHDATLARVNRGHGFAAYRDAVRRSRWHGVPVCTHLIVGLPGETQRHSLETLERVLEVGVEGLKLHPLLIVQGSRMAAQYRRGEVVPPGLDEYAATAAEMIRRTPAKVIYHRVCATARAPTLIAPKWCGTRWPAVNAICALLAAQGGQGSAVP